MEQESSAQMLIYFLLLFSPVNPLKILVYNPKFAHSHVQFLGILADTLQEYGHEVTVLQPEVHSHVEQNGSKLARIVSVKHNEDTRENLKVHNNDDYWEDLWSSQFDPRDLLGSSWMLNQIFNSVARNVLSKKDLLQSLKEENFDLIVSELLDFTAIGLSHIISVETIVGVSSLGILEGTATSVGVPLISSYVPASHGVTGDDPSFWTRATNLVYSRYSRLFQEDMAASNQGIFAQMGYSIPDHWSAISKMPLIITNSDLFLDFPRQSLQNIVNIGSITVRKSSKLSQEFEDLLALRPKTVLISFGSIAFSSKMPQQMKDALVKTVDLFPNITFMLKYEEPENGPKSFNGNLVLRKWLPQNDLLADSRVGLFITHGGVASTYEAAAHGVPMLFVPSFGDQMRNAQMIKRQGFGKIIPKKDLRSVESFTATVRSCLEDKNMSKKAKQTSELLKRRESSPRELLARSVGKAVQLQKFNLNLKEFSFWRTYCLDAVLILLLTFVSVL